MTGVGGTYLCTDPLAGTNDPRTPYFVPGVGGKCGSDAFNPAHNLDEVAWTFSGGGFSHVFSKPAYQNTLPAGSTAIGSMRGVPDVAFQASAGTGALVYLSLPPDGTDSNVNQTGWYDIGGTSLSSPQVAGIVAIAAQLNGGGLGLINPALYKIGANPARYAADFYDVATEQHEPGRSLHPRVPGHDRLGSSDRPRDTKCGQPGAGPRRRSPRQLTKPRSSASEGPTAPHFCLRRLRVTPARSRPDPAQT